MDSLNKYESFNIINSIEKSNIYEKYKIPYIYKYFYNKCIKVDAYESDFILNNGLIDYNVNKNVFRHRFTCATSYYYIKYFNTYKINSFNNNFNRHFLKWNHASSETFRNSENIKIKENLYYEKEAIRQFGDKYSLIIK